MREVSGDLITDAQEKRKMNEQTGKTIATTEERAKLWARGWTDGLIKK